MGFLESIHQCTWEPKGITRIFEKHSAAQAEYGSLGGADLDTEALKSSGRLARHHKAFGRSSPERVRGMANRENRNLLATRRAPPVRAIAPDPAPEPSKLTPAACKPSRNLFGAILRDWDPAQDFGAMLRNGSYFAWFSTPLRKGTGVVVLNDGKVTGGDIVMEYTGTYTEDGDKFTACIATRRHTPGNSTVFGIDEIDLTVSGNSMPTVARCTGTAKQAPDMPFEATLVPIAD
jgi:hypothetical protein